MLRGKQLSEAASRGKGGHKVVGKAVTNVRHEGVEISGQGAKGLVQHLLRRPWQQGSGLNTEKKNSS